MHLFNYLKEELLRASKEAFGEARVILFGSRIDDSKREGDFDMAVVCDINKDEFKKAKVQFF